MRLDDWFLTAGECGADRSWTEGNDVEVLIDGAEYFRRVYAALCGLRKDDWVYFTDWEGDPDERLVGQGTEVGHVMSELARRGVHVRGLLWRSHPRQAHLSEQQNTELVEEVNKAGGELVLDERVRRGGSHHQKMVVTRDVAFIGGIDLCHGRHDDSRHEGDPQSVSLDSRYGDRPPWHDVQLQVRGPAVGDIAHIFRQRWEDPTPLDHRNPIRAVLRSLTREPRRTSPLPATRPQPARKGDHAVQVLRTYPAKSPRYPFAREGERSIGRAYLKAIRRARSLIYIEDQYLWSPQFTSAVADSLRRQPDLHLIAVVPRYPERDGRVFRYATSVAQQDVVAKLRQAGGDRVAIYNLENAHGTPIYVHAKICVIDDVWLEVGSDNLNQRSWTHDSEASCAILDTTFDNRAPIDPGGLGDRARVLARDTRLRLWREHLGRTDGDDSDLIDPVAGFGAWRASAAALDKWHQSGCRGARPPGRARRHEPEPVPRWHRWWSRAVQSFFIDPDGRPRRLRGSDEL